MENGGLNPAERILVQRFSLDKKGVSSLRVYPRLAEPFALAGNHIVRLGDTTQPFHRAPHCPVKSKLGPYSHEFC